MAASVTPGRALRYAGGSARGLLHQALGHYPAAGGDLDRSPLARGSTDVTIAPEYVEGPFPARAGINRDDRRQEFSRPTVPRSRGDQPGADVGDGTSGPRSPLARGSTGRADGSSSAAGPFPARAGINRRSKP
ncbi:hypothetical protein Ga0080574_TMP2629 [Salipiger abyssi]|uniref:Uncharacterized protein n=1 Tax=Salipiger abyssi TaxID=1250539 RepID=A0A1P8UU95_9RHOB|nr:hypothetical protein Ga0080574_TMP2629 [Salipiger abyssi]